MIADETYGGQKNPNFAENVGPSGFLVASRSQVQTSNVMELLNFAQRLVRGN
jgi:hypothetical protein